MVDTSWNEKSLTYFCTDICKQRGDIDFTIPVRINGRLTRTLGRVKYTVSPEGRLTPTVLEISANLLANATDKAIVDVILHECAHYCVTVSTLGEDHGHDFLFQKWCKRLGTENSKPATKVEYKSAEIEAEQTKTKYVVTCSSCNKIVGRYTRMSYKLRNINLYQCGFCGKANLTLTQNW